MRWLFRPDGETSGARWLYGIARNVLGASARSAEAEKRKYVELGMRVPLVSQEQRDELALLATEQGVLAALEQLPEQQREAVHAYFLGSESYADIARRTGEAEPTIRKRVSRGIAMLRRDIKEFS